MIRTQLSISCADDIRDLVVKFVRKEYNSKYRIPSTTTVNYVLGKFNLELAYGSQRALFHYEIIPAKGDLYPWYFSCIEIEDHFSIVSYFGKVFCVSEHEISEDEILVKLALFM